jgi:hypothetical protein
MEFLIMNRRVFLKTGAAALPLASGGSLFASWPAAPGKPSERIITASSFPEGKIFPADPDRPWPTTIRRIGQTNFTEHDPVAMDVEQWADYWHSLKCDIVFVSVTGILAFYPTQVPFHRRGKFLGNRDFFGDCFTAAKKRGMRVVARMSPDLNWDDALQAHPEWAMRDAANKVQRSLEDPRLFKTCMYSTYMTDYMPAIIREINSRYEVDAFYTNGWPPIGNLPVCFCENCKDLPAAGTPSYWDAFNKRVFFLWNLYDGLAKQRKPTNIYFANMGGGVHAGPNLSELGKICSWFEGDNQGRGTETDPIWGCTLQGRVCNAVLDGKMAANITAAYSTGPVRWRNASKSPAEATMWLNETLASGMVPYYHFIGAEKGLGEDRRWQKLGYDYYNWTAKHDRHLTTKRSLANVGVLIGQRTQLFYTPPTDTRMQQYTDGIYYALLKSRIPFDFVHEERLQPERLAKYHTLILPNTALLSESQCAQLGEFVNAGGSLLATFETSMYDEHNKRRADFGLADVLGVHVAGPVVGTNGNACYSRIERQHAILAGFADTNWLPGSQNRLTIAPIESPVLTVVPGFVNYPPELAYPPLSNTNEPAVVLRERGRSRTAYFAGDVERTMWHSGQTDLLHLLGNTIRWLTREDLPYAVVGDGFIETFAWETEAGYAVHILNYSNPNAFRGWLDSTLSIGAQNVTLKLAPSIKILRVELLRGGQDVHFERTGDRIHFTIPRVDDYEIAAIHVA